MDNWSLKSFEIDYVKDLLGQGKYGYVYKAFCFKYNSFCALKIIYDNPEDPKQCINIFREYKIMSNVQNCSNLEKIYGYFTDFKDGKKCYCFILEFIEGENLNRFLSKHKFIEQNLLIKIFYDIANGLDYLHKNGIFHRDIAPDNIMIDKNNNIKITDFGLSAYYVNHGNINDNLVSNYSVVGRLLFVGSELLKKKESGDKSLLYDIKNDIFAFGVTMFYLMTLAYPKSIESRKKEKVEGYTFVENINNALYCQNLIELVKSMIEEDQNKRPTCKEIMNKLDNIKNRIIPSFKCAIDCLRSFDVIYNYFIKNEYNLKNSKLQLYEYSFINNFILFLKDPDNINKFISSFYEKISIYGVFDIIYPIDIIKVIFDYFLTNSPYIYNNEKGHVFFEKNYNFYENNNKPTISNKIKEFESLYNNKFVTVFYFLVLKTYKCQNCNSEINQNLDIKTNLDLFIDNKIYKISDLIKNFNEKKNFLNMNVGMGGIPCQVCRKCGKMSKILDEYNKIVLFPDVLIVNLMFETKLEQNIDIDDESKYYLSCVIFYNFNKNTYEYAILNNKKHKNEWEYYSNEGIQILEYKEIKNKKGAKTLFYCLDKNEFTIFNQS